MKNLHNRLWLPKVFLYITGFFILLMRCDQDRGLVYPHYTDAQHGFRIQAPGSGWTITDETGITDVLVILKSEVTVQDFAPNVTVLVEKLPTMMNAFEYGEQNQEMLSLQGIEILSSKKLIVNKMTFYEFHCVNRDVTPPLRFRYLSMIKDQLAFTITCSVPGDYYDRFREDFDLILASFRFL